MSQSACIGNYPQPKTEKWEKALTLNMQQDTRTIVSKCFFYRSTGSKKRHRWHLFVVWSGFGFGFANERSICTY